jgi:hypothetical protein
MQIRHPLILQVHAINILSDIHMVHGNVICVMKAMPNTILFGQVHKANILLVVLPSVKFLSFG